MKQPISLCMVLGWMLLAFPSWSGASSNIAFSADKPEATAASDTIVKKGWWTVELETASNSSFYGRNTATKFPYAATSLTYVHNSGLWASATTYKLFNTKAVVDETDVSVGYAFKVGKRVTNNIIYSRFFFSEQSPLLKAVTSNAASIYSAVDWNILYTALTTSYVFGGSNDLFVVLENSRYLPLNPLWKGKRQIGLDPKIGITAGTQEFSQTYTQVQQTKNNNNSGSPGTGGGLVGDILNPLNPGNGNGNGGSNNSGSTTTTTTTTTTVTEHKFRILNYDFKVPVVISFGSLEVEPSWRYSIPVNLLEGDESKAQSIFSVKGSYTF
ncbi:hypothetical protein [Botryobacter ruber]|uniref:hypothetical protein n=1 Tax=Botryobacter ruber TaxID=2171629 RepID=UPI000F64C500|nr:hypothetical protein [Botryobacter ruber]